MIEMEDEGGQEEAVAYLADLEPSERTEEREGDDVRVCERYDGPFADDAPPSIRTATLVYLYTNYTEGGESIESQELDVYQDDDDAD